MGYESFKIKMEGWLKIRLLSKRTNIQASKAKDRLVILGNGPSLSKDLEPLKKLCENADCLGVNYFAATQEFLIFKPRFYSIVSKQYWGTDENSAWDNDRKRIFDVLIEKVNWEMHLFVPMIARSSESWKKHIEQNPNIKVNYFNLTPLDDFPMFFKRSLEKYKACPRPHNVLIPSILFGVNMKYPVIYIAGADHSWIPEIFVTQDNIVMAAQKHFYAEQLKSLDSTLLSDNAKPFFYSNTVKPMMLHEVLHKFYFSFKSYWFLKEYAEIKGSTIYNLTEGSFIDAFDKISYDDISG
ncbi:hypothetical protein N9355_01140 [Crocinitomicaceae bacterium]|nr:hypothetical protein [Crocinitomicaceae bacterium]